MSLFTDVHRGVPQGRTTAPLRNRDTELGAAANAPKKRTGRALFLLPAIGNDPTEIVMPWELLTKMGCFVEFATWHGQPAKADESLRSSMLWGATARIRERWEDVLALTEYQEPYAWAKEDASHTPSATTAKSRKELDIDSYDLVYIPGGWCARAELENDTKIHALLERFTRYIPRSVGTKILAVSGDGIAPLLHVKRGHPDIQRAPSSATASTQTGDAPTETTTETTSTAFQSEAFGLLKTLASSGPGYESITGPITGTDFGSLIPSRVREYKGARMISIDSLNWYISAPSSNFAKEMSRKMARLLACALEVSYLREIAAANASEAAPSDSSIEHRRKHALALNANTTNLAHLTAKQRHRLEVCERWDGATEREKELADVDGLGVQDTGFAMSKWNWGWRKHYN
ncbi:hypothetical protein PYCC9005_002208 [Savitreella phatthalungensis]